MITPEQFYPHDDRPDDMNRRRMWTAIQRGISPSSLFTILDRRSFLFGVAAAVLLYFTVIGVSTSIREAMNSAKPQAVRLDEAYQSAIEEFERLVPAMAYNSTISKNDKNYVETRKQQINNIDLAIAGLKSEMQGGDLSPLKQQRLRQLYGMKLNVLQQLINYGEIEL